ncbi:MAG: response regulator [Leptospiraceae bacterium]|nr:response regulator [Leptospiraceae bacterium]
MVSILVLEDEEALKEVITILLSRAGYKVEAASNGIEGLEVLENFKPDLIISDIMMPEMDGYSFLEKIRQSEEFKNIPFIFLSAKTEKADIRKGMNLNADDYLTKPFMKQDMLDAIDAKLKRASQSESRIKQELEKFEKMAFDALDKKKNEQENSIEFYKELKTLQDTLYSKNEIIDKLRFINSHHLRASLSNISGLLQLINHDLYKDANPYLNDIQQTANELDSIIKDISEILSEENISDFIIKEKQKKTISQIMVVDDDPLSILILESTLNCFNKNWVVQSYSDSKEALSFLKKSPKKPDILFLDINMPGLNAWDFLEHIKGDNNQYSVYIVSSSVDSGDIKKAHSFSCVMGYITKPVSEEKLQDILLQVD